MPARILDPGAIAATFREQLAKEIATLPQPIKLCGFLAEGHPPAATYAQYTRRACEAVGIHFDLRVITPSESEARVREAGGDKSVHGILVYYPIGTQEADLWLRELVDPRKDIEGLHSFWARCLYENRRFIDTSRLEKAILPCTPLAVLKLLEAAGATRVSSAKPLAGVRACIFNRSELVGRPLATMMANDGAEVVSFDIDGANLFVPDSSRGGHEVRPTEVTRAVALGEADIVITGVPNRSFQLVRGDEIKPGAVCVNFSTLKNFHDDVVERASAFVPRIGPMTITMAMRNTLRLYRNMRLA